MNAKLIDEYRGDDDDNSGGGGSGSVDDDNDEEDETPTHGAEARRKNEISSK